MRVLFITGLSQLSHRFLTAFSQTSHNFFSQTLGNRFACLTSFSQLSHSFLTAFSQLFHRLLTVFLKDPGQRLPFSHRFLTETIRWFPIIPRHRRSQLVLQPSVTDSQLRLVCTAARSRRLRLPEDVYIASDSEDNVDPRSRTSCCCCLAERTTAFLFSC